MDKIAFAPKPDGHTYRLTDISNYRVALLLKNKMILVKIIYFVNQSIF